MHDATNKQTQVDAETREEVGGLLRTPDAAEHLDVSARTLEDWRLRSIGPPYVRFGVGTIRYRISDLDAWVQAHVVNPDDPR